MIPIAASSADAPAAVQHDVQHYMRPGTLQLAALPPLSLYVHLPWCLKKCPYCDFNSHEQPGGVLPEQRYVDAVVADLEAALPLIWGRTIHSIFIGGGTPSLFAPATIDRLIGDIRARLRLEPQCEITMEANPGTFEKDRFRGYAQAGVTRLSIGVQSFNDTHLQALGRVHDRAQAIAAVEEAAQSFPTFNLDIMYALPGQTLEQVEEDMAMEANPGTFEKDRFRGYAQAGVTRLSIGVQSFNDTHLQALGRVHDRAQAIAAVEEAAQSFQTFNLDIMYALPGQTLEQLEQDMAMALQFAPPHISIYHLTIEPNTYFAKYPPQIPEDDTAYGMLDRITELTGVAGLERYEVSAYARQGHRCLHNLNYWQFGDYLGIGAGAHSKLSFAHRVVRQVRFREPRLYMERALVGNALAQAEEVGRAELPFEYMLNALRLRNGFGLRDFTERTGLAITAIEAALLEAERKGLIERDFARVRPTVRGFDFLSDLQALFLSNAP